MLLRSKPITQPINRVTLKRPIESMISTCVFTAALHQVLARRLARTARAVDRSDAAGACVVARPHEHHDLHGSVPDAGGEFRALD